MAGLIGSTALEIFMELFSLLFFVGFFDCRLKKTREGRGKEKHTTRLDFVGKFCLYIFFLFSVLWIFAVD